METTEKRSIRSYVLRQGRITDAQARALDKHWPDYGIDFEKKQLDLAQVFYRRAPLVLDIGSGMGETLIQITTAHPENDYLAVEVHRPGVGSMIKNAVNKSISNVRIINHDVMEVLQYQLPNNSLDEVYIFFPDPWPKKRHHKRRLINPEFLLLLKPALKSHARIFIATDLQDHAEHVLNICDNDKNLCNLAGKGNYAPRPAWRPLTKFEQRGMKLDHPVWDLCYTKI